MIACTCAGVLPDNSFGLVRTSFTLSSMLPTGLSAVPVLFVTSRHPNARRTLNPPQP